MAIASAHQLLEPEPPAAPSVIRHASPTERSPLLQLSTTKATDSVAITVKPSVDDLSADDDDASVAAELRDLLALAYPVVLTTALEFMPGFTSTILAGHLDSPLTKEYVDAATLSTMFLNISGYSIGFGFATALDTLASQAFGAQRATKIGVYLQSGLLVTAACLLPIVVVNYAYSAPFLLAMDQDPVVAELAQQFSRYSLVGLPFVLVYELQRQVLQAQGIMAPLVVIAVASNLVHIVSGYWLAYCTPLGFVGIAISRSLSNVTLPLFLALYFRFVRPDHLSQWWAGWDLAAATRHVGLFLRLGVPGLLMMVMEWWAFEILSLLSGVLPDRVVAVSAHAVQANVASLGYMTVLGFSVAANIRVGHHLGANQPRRARLVSRLAIKLVAGIGMSFALALLLGRHAIPWLFVGDALTVDRASHVLLVWACFEPVEALNCLMQGIFQGAGRQDTAARTNAVAYYAVGMPLAYALGLRAGWGVEGLWLGFGLGMSVSLLTLLSSFGRWHWRALADAAQERTAE
ncbi:hypothetical protein P43SY_001183 [Pythium insidiosum]|uniref:Multidrug/Oligosaccharidyl-lipid/Polysaccharide (MOP) Flippase Superfamily n=1 Tax=Pythium insidiosum TaxID=114742 RepID=A0AAD5LHB1_PYTIN|nr:hypothetical protein P43SY_001183 [Pythium insidiosum]